MISFVMPVHDMAPGLIEEAVASVLVLDPDVELVVVDDGSTAESTVTAVAALPGRDPRIRVVRQDNGGVASARNRGIREASRAWVAFLDPDDRCRPEMRDALRLLAGTDRDLVVTGGAGMTVAGEAAERYDLRSSGGERSGIDLLSEMMSLYLHGRRSGSFVLGVPWAKLVRRSFLLEHGLFFTDGLVKRSDAEWLIRVYEAAGTVFVADLATVDYRIDVPGNISRRFRPEILDAFDRLRATAAAAPVSPEVRELYYVELLKDAVNSVFSSPAAPREVRSRSAYRRFRGSFEIGTPLLRNGRLRAATLPRKLLYVVIRRGWFAPVVVLRAWKRIRAAR